MVKWNLFPGRGTKLVKNTANSNKLYITPQDQQAWDEIQLIYVILDDTIAPLNHMGIRSQEGYMIMIPPQAPFMVINLSQGNISVKISDNIVDRIDDDNNTDVNSDSISVGISSIKEEGFEIIYDPYLLENKPHEQLDPEYFISQDLVPSGYIDVLIKWYSVKFTYPDYNLIFIRPGLGISLQTHQFREEHWKICRGKPIIITGSKVYYNTSHGDEFNIPFGVKHTIINPSQSNWVILEETYKGTFDEEDIVRLFNPNNYSS
ncbi:MAG: hypothetical protein K9W44_18535 [Candidatus Lokiarchaeota archaeon]|nr:hypothetical protein [Candidatus Harpocratesius repetitus]